MFKSFIKSQLIFSPDVLSKISSRRDVDCPTCKYLNAILNRLRPNVDRNLEWNEPLNLPVFLLSTMAVGRCK